LTRSASPSVTGRSSIQTVHGRRSFASPASSEVERIPSGGLTRRPE
jgi:hypothetical protein